MLQHFGQIGAVVNGMGALVENQKPFVRFLVNNWPLTLIAGAAMAWRLKERWKAKEITPYNIMADAGLMLSPLVGLALLNQLAQQDHERAKAIAAELIAQGYQAQQPAALPAPQNPQ